ncbi:MAG: DUF1987 domain-containing protein [Bacteroidales bacterium]|nr:DUF1987 domain-containing protein [Bacteroidales bacterium]
MESIYIQKTKKTPLINLNIKDSIFQIKGPSFSENIVEVLNPIIDWIENCIPNLENELICELYFTVLNSASHKKIFQILIKLNAFLDNGKVIKVKWYYDEDDEDIMEMGEDLVELINIPFELIPVKY